jgi:hypothetical protein
MNGDSVRKEHFLLLGGEIWEYSFGMSTYVPLCIKFRVSEDREKTEFVFEHRHLQSSPELHSDPLDGLLLVFCLAVLNFVAHERSRAGLF